jgi:ubiquinone biosynthesis protein COQ9
MMRMNMSPSNQLEVYRRQIVEAALPNIAFDGWTKKTLEQAARQAGIDRGYVRLAFPNGPVDAIAWHSAEADAAMADYIRSFATEKLPLPVRIRKAVLWRLQQNFRHREAIRRALVLLTFPTNSVTALKLLYNTVDTIWYEVGDQSVDFNFYTKRMTLAAIYSATLHFWLDDDSAKQEDTAEFLDRRLNDVRSFGQWKKKLTQRLALPS